MNKLIKTFTEQDGAIAVDGRDLHDFLDVKERYNDWFPRMIEYGFEENVDFVGFTEKTVKPRGGRPQLNHALTLDMAKELSMIQRTPKGKEARQYFIAVEKKHKQQVKLPQNSMEVLELFFESQKENTKDIKEVKHRVVDLEDNQSLAPGEYNYISHQVSKAVHEYIQMHDFIHTQQQRAKLYKDISRGLNEVTGVKTRTQLRRKNFETADEFISNWKPSTATIQIIKQLDDRED